MNHMIIDEEYIRKELQEVTPLHVGEDFRIGDTPFENRIGFQDGLFVNRSFELLANTPFLTFLGLQNCEGINDDDLGFLSTLRDLKWIYVNCSNLDCSFLRFLDGRLRKLDIWFSTFPTKNYQYLKRLTGLEYLTVVGSNAHEDIIDFVESDKLVSLDLRHDEFFKKPNGLRRFNNLNYIFLQDCVGVGFILPTIADSYNKLTNLYLTNSDASDVEILKMASLGMPELEVVDLSLSKITDRTLDYLKECSKITLLYLNGTNVSMKGIESLRSAKFRESLHVLELIDTNPPYDLNLISELFPNLWKLTLRFSDVDCAQLKRLGWRLESSGKYTAYYEHPNLFHISYYKAAYADEWKMLSSPKRLMKEPQVSFI